MKQNCPKATDRTVQYFYCAEGSRQGEWVESGPGQRCRAPCSGKYKNGNRIFPQAPVWHYRLVRAVGSSPRSWPSVKINSWARRHLTDF
ncbi:MAG TPA: hypothetical protein GX706_04825 [Candidatus Moranbacteria bacterium]|nr:hypothetical protein [Candidatus Moranbacteria bacterium]